MRKKVIDSEECGRKCNLKELPAWYWEYGLHDAKILFVSELTAYADFKIGQHEVKCLEICLDSSNAVFEQEIQKIILYNHEIETEEIDIQEICNTWWIGDSIDQLPCGKYFLEIETINRQGELKMFAVKFENAIVER